MRYPCLSSASSRLALSAWLQNLQAFGNVYPTPRFYALICVIPVKCLEIYWKFSTRMIPFDTILSDPLAFLSATLLQLFVALCCVIPAWVVLPQGLLYRHDCRTYKALAILPYPPVCCVMLRFACALCSSPASRSTRRIWETPSDHTNYPRCFSLAGSSCRKHLTFVLPPTLSGRSDVEPGWESAAILRNSLRKIPVPDRVFTPYIDN